MLKREDLGEKLPRCKSFRFCSSVEGLEVMIRRRLGKWVFGSADCKELASNAGRVCGGRAIIHNILYTESKQRSREFVGGAREA